MTQPNKADILITLSDQIRKLQKEAKEFNEFPIHFESIETKEKWPAGSVSENLDEASKDAGCQVLRKGSNSASLRKILESGSSAFV